MLQHETKRAAVVGDDRVESPAGSPVEPALLGFGFAAQQSRRHHRSQRKRHDCGNQNRHAQRHRELSKEAADDVSHEQEWNQHGDQRHRQRNDREADLHRTHESSLDRLFTLFDVPRNVFDHNDGIVHDEAGGNRQSHQRQVVQAVSQQVHDAESSDERQGHRDTRDHGSRKSSQKNKNDQHDEHDCHNQLELDVFYGSADRVGPVCKD